MNVNYVVRETLINTNFKSKAQIKNVVTIFEELTLDNNLVIYLPSSLTHFITFSSSSKSINTQKNIAYVICEFMNYIKSQISTNDDTIFSSLKCSGLYGLNFTHASSFLNYCISNKHNSFRTIKQKETELLHFYDFLSSRKIININYKIEYQTIKKKDKEVKSISNSPFKENEYKVMYPSPKTVKNRKLNNMDFDTWNLLLDLSEIITPDITFGIVLEIMGGIRRGEVVNLILNDINIQNHNNIIELNICDRYDELFASRGVNSTKSNVKKPRSGQFVFNFNGGLFKYYDNHIELRQILLSKTNNYSRALFLDSDGNPMTGDVYTKRFTKLKIYFLKILSDISHSNYVKYKTNTWSTHICRGIFTNLVISNNLCNDGTDTPNARLLANLRGDFGIDSSVPYIDMRTLIEKANLALNKISSNAVKKESYNVRK